MKSVFCDDCKGTFFIDAKVEQLENDVERVYFICPHCKTKFVAYYTNTLIKRKQEKIKLILAEYNAAAANHNRVESERLFAKYDKLHKEIKKDMANLRKKIEGASTK